MPKPKTDHDWGEIALALLQTRLAYVHETSTCNRYGFADSSGIVREWRHIEGADFKPLAFHVLFTAGDMREAALAAYAEQHRDKSSFLICCAMALMEGLKNFLPSERVLPRQLLRSLRDEDQRIDAAAFGITNRTL